MNDKLLPSQLMQNRSVIIIMLVTFQLFSQTTEKKSTTSEPRYSESSEMKVIYKDNKQTKHIHIKPAIFINGKRIKNESALRTIDKNKIETVEINNKNSDKAETTNKGQIFIKTKLDYEPSFMSLTAFSENYLELNSNPIIFQIDKSIISENYDDYIVDTKYILKTIIEPIRTSDNNIEITLISLITRTPENIDQANRIIIRGSEF
ncbi:hypothetical protein [Winogradskyella bathintestinalis]|uniref:Gliding motility-associated protein GldM C-terminal domain-containing protein n=1 Tax=Winogradskyella bathintestinalis TaxID=3035208 RepID=A0ABT7ZRR5_9FLAO|nr:hypothetical protein [Winogradskyella bathintestinalis]MDN3491681.1 hypothetical protein [Winogradskyella bathintestinalis]